MTSEATTKAPAKTAAEAPAKRAPAPAAKAPQLKVGDVVRFRDPANQRDRDGELEVRNALVARVWQNGTVNLVYVQSPARPDKSGAVATAQCVPLESLL